MRYGLNSEHNGVEIYFDAPPQDDVRNKLISNGFHWHYKKRCWYAKQSRERLELVRSICGEGEMVMDYFIAQPETLIEQPPMNSELEARANRMCCYAAKMQTFMGISEAKWKDEMYTAFKQNIQLPLGESQIKAWEDCFVVLRRELKNSFSDFNIVFEYILPYENGRRPDVLLISEEVVIILEFKRKVCVLTEDIDQAADYGRDLREYHFESRNKKAIVPMLVLTRGAGINCTDKGVHICTAENLKTNICQVVEEVGE